MKKYSISDFTIDLKMAIHKGVHQGTVRDLVEDAAYHNIDFDVFLPSIGKNLQRGFVWTLLQKQQLVLSVLKRIELPSIAVIIEKTHTTTERNVSMSTQVIDGKQRLSTMLAYYRNEFALDYKGEEVFYKDLDQPAQFLVWNFGFTFDIVYSHVYADASGKDKITDKQKIAWFEMINFAGTPQDDQHLKDLKS